MHQYLHRLCLSPGGRVKEDRPVGAHRKAPTLAGRGLTVGQ